MKAKIIQAKTLQAKIQDTKTINAIMRWGLVIHENIELSKEWNYIVWRTVGKLEWKRLIPISELKVKWDDGKKWDSGYTPVKWIDYFDWYTPKKWIDYFDWKNWKDAVWTNGKDWNDWLSAFELWKLEDWNKNKTVQDFWKWLRREWEHIVMAWSLNVVPTGWTTGQVLKKKSNNDFDLEWGTGWWGWSWIVDSIVAWTNIDVDNTDPANPIISVENLVLADITDVTATVTELNYIDWVTSAIQTQLDTKLQNNLGRTGWTTLVWGTASWEDLTLSSTSNATKGNIFFGTSTYDEVNNRLGIWTTEPTHTLTLPSTSTGFAIYNTADKTTNYERMIGKWNSNRFEMWPTWWWTASSRVLRIWIPTNTWTDAIGRYLDIWGNTMFSFAEATSTANRVLIWWSLTSTASSLAPYIYSANITANQTLTAGWTLYHWNVIGTDWGSWTKRFIDLYNQWVSKYYVDNNGNWVYAWSVTVLDEAYDATGWNGDLSVPTKNAIRDKIESMSGGWSQPYTALSSDTTITQGNVYWVNASTVDINLTLSDGTSAWQTLTVSKRDETDYSVYVNNATLDWWTIQLTIFEESIDLYRTGTTFIIK